MNVRSGKKYVSLKIITRAQTWLNLKPSLKSVVVLRVLLFASKQSFTLVPHRTVWIRTQSKVAAVLSSFDLHSDTRSAGSVCPRGLWPNETQNTMGWMCDRFLSEAAEPACLRGMERSSPASRHTRRPLAAALPWHLITPKCCLVKSRTRLSIKPLKIYLYNSQKKKKKRYAVSVPYILYLRFNHFQWFVLSNEQKMLIKQYVSHNTFHCLSLFM